MRYRLSISALPLANARLAWYALYVPSMAIFSYDDTDDICQHQVHIHQEVVRFPVGVVV